MNFGAEYRRLMAKREVQSRAESDGQDLPFAWSDLDDEAMNLLHDLAGVLGWER